MAPAPKYSHQEQEELILKAAADCIWESSLTDFTMAAVSRAASLSMGSIYKHVQCKEDIMFALAVRTFSQVRRSFEKVLALELSTPEKVAAIALISPKKIQVYPFDTQLEGIVNNEAIIKRASPLWTERMFTTCQQCEKAFYTMMEKAVLAGEVELEGDKAQAIEEFNLGCWALMEGFQKVERILQLRAIAQGTDTLDQAPEIDSPQIKNLKRLVNTYNWQQPLTDEGIEKASKALIEMNLR